MYNTIAKLTRQVENWHSIQIVCAVLLCLYVLNGYDTVTAIERSWEMLNGGKRANRNPSMLSAAEQQQAGYIDCRNRISHAPAFMLFFFSIYNFFLFHRIVHWWKPNLAYYVTEINRIDCTRTKYPMPMRYRIDADNNNNQCHRFIERVKWMWCRVVEINCLLFIATHRAN